MSTWGYQIRQYSSAHKNNMSRGLCAIAENKQGIAQYLGLGQLISIDVT
jgi:hypothetical protein